MFAAYIAISKKVVMVNSRYWNRKELLGSSSTNNLLMLALTLHVNIECRFIIMARSYSNKLRWRVILIMSIPKIPFGSSIDF